MRGGGAAGGMGAEYEGVTGSGIGVGERDGCLGLDFGVFLGSMVIVA